MVFKMCGRLTLCLVLCMLVKVSGQETDLDVGVEGYKERMAARETQRLARVGNKGQQQEMVQHSSPQKMFSVSVNGIRVGATSAGDILSPSQLDLVVDDAPSAVQIGSTAQGSITLSNRATERLTFDLTVENPSITRLFEQRGASPTPPTRRKQVPKDSLGGGKRIESHGGRIGEEVVAQTIRDLLSAKSDHVTAMSNGATTGNPVRLMVQTDPVRMMELLSMERVPPPGVKRPENGVVSKTSMPYIKLDAWPTSLKKQNVESGDADKQVRGGRIAATSVHSNHNLGGVVSNTQLLERVGTVIVELSPTATEEQIAALVMNVAADDQVHNIEADREVTVNQDADLSSRIPNDADFSRQWGPVRMKLPSAWARVTGEEQSRDRRPVVCVIDTGIDYSHFELNHNMWINTAEAYGEEGVDDDLNGFVDDVYGINSREGTGEPKDGHGHGTHCAGVIGAQGDNDRGIAGINWAPLLMGCKFLDDRGSGATSDAIKCLNYAVMMGANITSNSWGGPGSSQALVNAIDAAADAGQLFVAAAGNDGLNVDVTPVTPGSIVGPNVITVAAINDGDELASFSNYGVNNVEVAAPGVGIWSTRNGDRFLSLSGTSMAAPHVAGLASLLLSSNPDLTFSEILDIFLESVDPIQSLATRTNWAGVIDADLAMQMAEESSPWVSISTPRVTLLPGASREIGYTIHGKRRGAFEATIRSSATLVGGTAVTDTAPISFTIDLPPVLDIATLPSLNNPIHIVHLDKAASAPEKIRLVNLGMGVVKVNVAGVDDVNIIETQPRAGLSIEIGQTPEFLQVRCLFVDDSVVRRSSVLTLVIDDSTDIALWKIPVLCTRVPLVLSPTEFNVNVNDDEVDKRILMEMELTASFSRATGVSLTLSIEYLDDEARDFTNYMAVYSPSFADQSLPPGGGDDPLLWAELRGRAGAYELTDLRFVDDGRVPVELPFDPMFNGRSTGATTMWVSTNGFVALQPWDHTDDWVVNLGSRDTPNAVISPYWQDLTLSSQFTLDDASVWVMVASDRVIVQWNNMGAYSRNDVKLTFQAHLLVGGTIGFVYYEAVGPLPGTVGLEDQAGQTIASFRTRPNQWPKKHDWLIYKAMRGGPEWMDTVGSFSVINFPVLDTESLIVPFYVTPLSSFTQKSPGKARIVVTSFVEDVEETNQNGQDFIIRSEVPINVVVGTLTTTTTTTTLPPGCPICPVCPIIVNPISGDGLINENIKGDMKDPMRAFISSTNTRTIQQTGASAVCSPVVFADFTRFESQALVDVDPSDTQDLNDPVTLCECLTVCHDAQAYELGMSRPCKGVLYRHIDSTCQLLFVNRFNVGAHNLHEFPERYIDYLELKELSTSPLPL